MEWNFTIQKQLGSNVFTVAYVGELGRHLNYATNVNLPAPSGTATTPAYLRAATLPNITDIHALRYGRSQRQRRAVHL